LGFDYRAGTDDDEFDLDPDHDVDDLHYVDRPGNNVDQFDVDVDVAGDYHEHDGAGVFECAAGGHDL
jgi:hypothetical protein